MASRRAPTVADRSLPSTRLPVRPDNARAQKYDANDRRSRSTYSDEVYAAIDDYFNNLFNPASGGLTKEQVYKIIDLYFDALLGS